MEKPRDQHQEGGERVGHAEDIKNRDRAAENSGKKEERWNSKGIGEGAAAGSEKKANEEHEIREICRQGHQERGQQSLMVGRHGPESPAPSQDDGHHLRGDLHGDGEDELLNRTPAGGRKMRDDVDGGGLGYR